MASNRETGNSSNVFSPHDWDMLWKLPLKHKLKFFMWKCIRGILPVNSLIKGRSGKGNSRCVCCGQENETIEHMFFFCDHAQAVWKHSLLRWDGLDDLRNNFKHWWIEVMEAGKQRENHEHITLTVNILWHVWKSRNEVQFNQKMKEPHKVSNKAVKDWNEYDEVLTCRSREERVRIVSRDCFWRRPKYGEIKFNVDAALDTKKGRAGWGLVARDSNGTLVTTWTIPVKGSNIPVVEEASAIRMAMIKALEKGWDAVCFETDCKAVADKIQQDEKHDVLIGAILEDIFVLRAKFQECCFSFTIRENNHVGHKLAKFALNLYNEIQWEGNFPLWLSDTAKADIRDSCPTL